MTYLSNLLKKYKLKKGKISNCLIIFHQKKQENYFQFLKIQINSNKFKQIRNNAIITLCLNCGLRISEVCKLNVSDIKENSDTFIIYGKGRKERTGYLNKQTKETLLCYIQEREKYALQKNIMTDALFITERKCRITPRTIQRDLKALYKNAEIDENKYSVHTLRHTCATILYKSGYDIKLIQEIIQSICQMEKKVLMMKDRRNLLC